MLKYITLGALKRHRRGVHLLIAPGETKYHMPPPAKNYDMVAVTTHCMFYTTGRATLLVRDRSAEQMGIFKAVLIFVTGWDL